MKTLTLKRKLRLYKIVLRDFQLNNAVFMCNQLNHRMHLLLKNYYYDIDVEIDFPELYISKPKKVHKYNSWWNNTTYGFKKRIEALKKAIQLTERKIKKTK